MSRTTKSLTASILRPTTSLRGDEPPTAYRGENLVLRGPLEDPYFEVFGGNKDLGEDYDLTAQPLSGAISATGGSTQINGFGTDFTNELHLGQLILVNGHVLGVKDIVDDDTFIADRAPTTDIAYESFVDANVNAGADTITVTAHPFITGDAVVLGTDNILPGALTPGIVLYANKVDANTVKLATSYANSIAGPFINITVVVNGGTHYMGFAALRLPQIFNILKKRGVLLTGNAVEFEKGHIIAVGSGELFVNGQPLDGDSLIATNRAQIAIFNPATNDYTVNPLGFDEAPLPCTIDVITGGTKGMSDGDKHSFMIAWWAGVPDGSDGFSNPCDPIKYKADGTTILKVDGTNNLFEFDFTAPLGGTVPTNAKGFIIYGSLAGKKTTIAQGATVTTSSPNDTLWENGPWYKLREVLFTDLDVNDKITLEYLDSDPTLGEEVTGNNDPVPDAEYVTLIEGRPAYISCFGKRTTDNDDGSNPGKSVVLSKMANPDAAPAEWRCKVDNTILGFIEGAGRWFMMTPSSLPFVVPTGLLGQSYSPTDDLQMPIISRPYWITGASNRYNITLVDDDLIGFSGNKIFTSVGNGDENVKKYELGTPVEDITRKWFGTHVFVEEDPKNNQILFFFSAAYKNTQGYWCSIVLPYSKARQAWLPIIPLSETGRDMIVSGVTKIDQRLEFLAGGRVGFASYETSTYRFDGFEEGEETTVTSMPYYLVWQPTDDGLEDMSKVIHWVRLMAKGTSMKVQLHGAKPGEELNIEYMEAGTNYIAEVDFEDSDKLTRYLLKKMKVKNLANYALRFSGEWDGVGEKDRLDELVVEVGTHGRRR